MLVVDYFTCFWAWYESSLNREIVNLIMVNDATLLAMLLTYLPCDALGWLAR